MIHISDETGLNPFDVWSVYTACTLHFKKGGKYDAFKFNFKGPRLKRETFMVHKHRYAFEKIAKRYPSKDQAVGYFVSNILAGNTWIGSMTDEAYSQFCGNLQSMDYNFKSDMSYLSQRSTSFDELIKPKDRSDMPLMYTEYQRGKCHLESLVTLDQLVGYSSHINKFVNDPLGIVSDITHRIVSYKPFIRSRVNVDKSKKIVLNLFTSVHK
jgi:hypothetical protein